MKKSKKNNSKLKTENIKFSKVTTLGKITHEEINKNAGFLGTKGKLLKALMEEKKIEREL